LGEELQVDIGLLDVRFRGKTLRVRTGSCLVPMEKRGGPRGIARREGTGYPGLGRAESGAGESESGDHLASPCCARPVRKPGVRCAP